MSTEPNNQHICDIIEAKLHLLSKEDTVTIYIEFATHAYAYKVFRDQRYEGYKSFMFPPKFVEHVEQQRAELQKKVAKLSSNM